MAPRPKQLGQIGSKEYYSPQYLTLPKLLNVASIHNSSSPFSSLLEDSQTLSRLHILASAHELAFAYNVTSPIRAITGAVSAADVLTPPNRTITSTSTSPN